MKETYVKETSKPELKSPILIEGLPGMGMVGKIAARFVIKQLNAQRFAELYSPHFPYYVLVNKKGSVRLLRAEFFSWRNSAGESDLVFLVGDSQAQTIEGQYEVTDAILEYAVKLGVKLIVTIGGYRKEAEEAPKVIAVSTNPKLLEKALEAKAVASPPGNPIVGTAGLLLGLAKFKKIDALCLLGETRGYLPDPVAAKSVLEVLHNMFGLQINLSGLDAQIEKSKEIVTKMREIEERRERYSQKMRRSEEERITYIS
jgi:uncharacterized protein (TIGR00162 family)